MKIGSKILILTSAVTTFFSSSVFAEPSKNFKVFLCFGQSNMSGAVPATDDDKKTTPRVMALAFNNCGNPSWQKDTWIPAREPLHCGDGSNDGNTNMGPVYAFGRCMADSLPNDTIGIIACGQSGVNIEYFMKNGKWNSQYRVTYPGGTNVWEWMLAKCKLAQKRGVITGIILHQGESNAGQEDWPTKVNSLLNDLKKECALPDNLPFVAGELLYGKQCSGHNTVIAKVPSVIPNSYVASAQGLSGKGDQFHFNRDSYLKLGARYAEQMMKAIHVANPVGINPKIINNKKALTVNNLKETSTTALYTISGKKLSASAVQNIASGKKHCIYVMQKPGMQASLVVNPR